MFVSTYSHVEPEASAPPLSIEAFVVSPKRYWGADYFTSGRKHRGLLMTDPDFAVFANNTSGSTDWENISKVLGAGKSARVGNSNSPNTVSGATFPAGENSVVAPFAASADQADYEFQMFALKKSLGSFTQVSYSGVGGTQVIPHDLGVVPQLIIVRRTSSTGSWIVYTSEGNTPAVDNRFEISTTDPNAAQVSGAYWPAAPTDTDFTVPSGLNASGHTYVAYLFGTQAGKSKVGSYTGTGTGSGPGALTGFGFRPRLVLIKSVASGNWLVYDAARGPHKESYLGVGAQQTVHSLTGIRLNFDSDGISFSNAASANFNASGVKYIYVAIGDTWTPNPTKIATSDKHADITLSNDYNTQTQGGFTQRCARATVGKTSGKYYFEWWMENETGTAANRSGAGLAIASTSLSVRPGTGADSIFVRSDGAVFANNVQVATAFTTGLNGANGDPVGMFVDIDNLKLWVRRWDRDTDDWGLWNNSGTDNPETNTGGIAFPASLTGTIIPIFCSGSTAFLTVGFGNAWPLVTGPMPTGASPW